MHPYQLHQTLVERGDTRIVRVNPGAVYHGVERLERDGLVEVVGTDRTGKRPERTTYRITDAGRAGLRRAAAPACSATSTPPTRSSPSAWPRRTSCPRDVVVDAADAAARPQGRAPWPRSRRPTTPSADLGLPRRYLLDVEHDLAAAARGDRLARRARSTSCAPTRSTGTSPFPPAFLEAKRAHRVSVLLLRHPTLEGHLMSTDHRAASRARRPARAQPVEHPARRCASASS